MSYQDQNSPTTTGFGSGNPNYMDASAGPQRQVPNAKPHGMDGKKKKRPHATDPILGQENKVFTAEEAGYVDSTTPKQCQTCEYFSRPNKCNLPLNQAVDPKNGCCNFWEENTIIPSSEVSTVARRYCRSCSSSADEKTVTCSKCGSMEWTDKPMSKFTYAGT